MAEVNGELIYEMLKRIQADIGGLKEGQREIKAELSSMRGTIISIQQDIHNMYGILARHDDRLDRIETRLDIRELAERPQSPFNPQG